MKNGKYILFILFIFILSACSRKDYHLIDQTSRPTEKFDSKNIKGVTEADLQFGKLRKENSTTNYNKDVKIIKNIRIGAKSFIEDQFLMKNLKKYENIGFKYYVNNKVKTTIFRGNFNHIINGIGYDYRIDIELIKDFNNIEKYTSYLKNKSSSLKPVMIKNIGNVLVGNINNNSYSSQVYFPYKNKEGLYLIKISSEYMSIPESLYLLEKFYNKIEK